MAKRPNIHRWKTSGPSTHECIRCDLIKRHEGSRDVFYRTGKAVADARHFQGPVPLCPGRTPKGLTSEGARAWDALTFRADRFIPPTEEERAAIIRGNDNPEPVDPTPAMRSQVAAWLMVRRFSADQLRALIDDVASALADPHRAQEFATPEGESLASIAAKRAQKLAEGCKPTNMTAHGVPTKLQRQANGYIEAFTVLKRHQDGGHVEARHLASSRLKIRHYQARVGEDEDLLDDSPLTQEDEREFDQLTLDNRGIPARLSHVEPMRRAAYRVKAEAIAAEKWRVERPNATPEGERIRHVPMPDPGPAPAARPRLPSADSTPEEREAFADAHPEPEHSILTRTLTDVAAGREARASVVLDGETRTIDKLEVEDGAGHVRPATAGDFPAPKVTVDPPDENGVMRGTVELQVPRGRMPKHMIDIDNIMKFEVDEHANPLLPEGMKLEFVEPTRTLTPGEPYTVKGRDIFTADGTHIGRVVEAPQEGHEVRLSGVVAGSVRATRRGPLVSSNMTPEAARALNEFIHEEIENGTGFKPVKIDDARTAAKAETRATLEFNESGEPRLVDRMVDATVNEPVDIDLNAEAGLEFVEPAPADPMPIDPDAVDGQAVLDAFAPLIDSIAGVKRPTDAVPPDIDPALKERAHAAAAKLAAHTSKGAERHAGLVDAVIHSEPFDPDKHKPADAPEGKSALGVTNGEFVDAPALVREPSLATVDPATGPDSSTVVHVSVSPPDAVDDLTLETPEDVMSAWLNPGLDAADAWSEQPTHTTKVTTNGKRQGKRKPRSKN